MALVEVAGVAPQLLSTLAPTRPTTIADLGEYTVIYQDTDQAWLELYAASCHDVAEEPDPSRARYFRDALLAQNPVPINVKSLLHHGDADESGSEDQSLNLRTLRLGAVSASCLSQQLKGRNYHRLDLAENQFGDSSSASLCALVHSLPRLKYLCLSGNALGLRACQDLAEELSTNETLETLILGEPSTSSSLQQRRFSRPNAVGSDGLRILLESLSSNPKRALRSLSLSRVSLDPEAGRFLASFLEEDRHLAHLDVSCNPILSEGVCVLLPQCRRLHLLDISDTGCRGELIHSQLCTMIQAAKHLSSLSLAFNVLEVRPLRRISRAIASSPSLSILNLAGTSMDTECISALVDSLINSTGKKICELDVSDNMLTEVEAASALAHLITKTSLQVLRLNRNPIGDAGICELADALSPKVSPPTGPNLQQLEVASCRIGVHGASHLFNSLGMGNTQMKSLKICDNYLDDQLDLFLLDQLSHIQELQLSQNRLSRRAILRASEVCSRNKARLRDHEPNALRAEVKRLQVQEIKFVKARQQVAKDETEIFVRGTAYKQSVEELRRLFLSSMKTQRFLETRIASLKAGLADRRAQIEKYKQCLSESGYLFESEKHHLQETISQKEEDLSRMKAQSEILDREFQRRKEEHPLKVQEMKLKIKEALENTEQLKERTTHVRQSLKSLQEKSLIDFTY